VEQSDADRAAVAREVLTEYADILRDAGQTLSEAEVRRYVREHYPAPPAPETVTVTFRDGSTETLSLRDGKWQSGTGLLYDELIERACLDRIASDARVLKERDARIAELEEEARESRIFKGQADAWMAVFNALKSVRPGFTKVGNSGMGNSGMDSAVTAIRELARERDAASARIAELENELRRALDGTVFHEKQAHEARAERDAALRALEEYQNGIGPMGSKGKGPGGDSRPNGEAGDKEAPSNPLPPAPIPLGADEKPFDQTMDAKLWAQEFVRRFPAHDEGLMLAWFANAIMRGYDTARAKYEHPVATRETVERVAEVCMRARHPACFAWDYVTGEVKDEWRNIARAALTAAGFTVQEGA